ncbi:MAG: hypothetical protein RLZZ117_2715 [Cyanobacteriota bacterium]
MAQPPDPLEALLRSLQEGHGTRLHPLELAEILWLARDLPSQHPASAYPLAVEPPPVIEQRGQESHGDGGTKKEESPPMGAPMARADGDPLRFALPSFFPPAPARAATSPSAAALLPDQALPTEADLRAVLPLRLQDVRLISQPRSLQMALKPLAALEPVARDDHPRRVLDEVETVESYARARRLWPVYRLPREPRLSLVLVVDGGLSMQVWQRLAEELQATLCQSAAFRDVRAVPLDPERPDALLGALAGAAEEQVVLILSDCSGRHWWLGGELQKLLRRLTRRGPVALLQVLPDWMWRRTALGIGRIVAVRNRRSLAANNTYQRLPLKSGEPLPPQGDDHVVLPLLTLEDASLAPWCALLLGLGARSHAAACLPVPWPAIQITPGEPVADETVEERAQRRVRSFVQRSSGPAERLLRVLGAAPVLTLPVMRLLQEAMGQEGGVLPLAELLLSGLIQRLDGGMALPSDRRLRRRWVDRIQFDFEPGVRDALLDTLSVPQTAEVVQRVSELIEHRWDQCEDVPPFQSFLLNPSQLGEDHPLAAMKPFATLTAEIIERLPGSAYQELARALRQGAAAEPPDPFPPEAFVFEEMAVPSAALRRLPPEEANQAFSTARFVEIPLDVRAFETPRLQRGRLEKETRSCRWFPEPLGTSAPLAMLHIPAGRFLMGSPPEEAGRDDDEGPQHEVRLREFFLARTPITQAQWRAVAQWERKEWEEEALWPAKMNPDPVAGLEKPEGFRGDDKPVVNVSWNEAMAFCRRLQLRTGKHYTLPSEAQWEYACRAGTTTPFAFGGTLSSELANYNATSSYGNGPKGENRKQTTPVGMFPANAWGLQDMHGNVWEWCLDHWHASYVGAPTDGSAWLEEKEGEGRLLRGGSWFFPPRFCRSAYRSRFPPGIRDYLRGFRVCCLPQDLLLTP